MDFNFSGIIIGVATFLIIGLFHPLVIKAEYHIGVRSWWLFLFLGIVAGVFSLLVESLVVSIILGVVAFSSFWSIGEVFQQRKRVEKGWFPANPKKKNNIMKKYSGIIYVTLLTVIAVALAATYIPGAAFLGAWVTPPVVLFIGLLFAFVFGQPYSVFNKKMSKMLLQYSVVGLGFGMNVEAALASGKDGMMFTIISVFGTLLLGWLVGRVLLKVDKNTSYLISSGTAICGGSAIAAVGPVIKAKDCEMSVALGTVFILNAVALFIFPPIGRCLGLNDVQFGTWAAIAIHDTSSVVGAGAAYSEAALEVATTIKLTRALWIIPVALITCVLFKSKDKKITVPWFILWFLVAMLVNTYLLGSVPQLGAAISRVARKCLALTMFFIGASLSPAVLRQVGVKPLLQGVILWVLVSVVALAVIVWC